MPTMSLAVSNSMQLQIIHSDSVQEVLSFLRSHKKGGGEDFLSRCELGLQSAIDENQSISVLAKDDKGAVKGLLLAWPENTGFSSEIEDVLFLEWLFAGFAGEEIVEELFACFADRLRILAWNKRPLETLVSERMWAWILKNHSLWLSSGYQFQEENIEIDGKILCRWERL